MSDMNDAEARASLDASEKLYYRIGEVSKLTGVKAHVLRYWETEFRWMAPPKSRSKQRLYRKRDIEFVWLLKRLLWDERYTIAGARQRIQDLGVEDALALLRQNDHGDGMSAGDENNSRASPMDAASSPSNSGGKGRSAGRQSKRKTKASTNGQGDAAVRGDSAHDSGSSENDALSEGRRAEWLAFGAALGDLHSELSAIRGALQEGL